MRRRVMLLALLATEACAPPEAFVLPDLEERQNVEAYLLYSHAVDQQQLFFTIMPFTPQDPPPRIFEATKNQRVYLKAMTVPLAELPGLTAGVVTTVQLKEADFPAGPVLEGATFELTETSFVEVEPSIATQPALPTLSALECVESGGCPQATLIKGTAASGVHWSCNPVCSSPPPVTGPTPPELNCAEGWSPNREEADFVYCAPDLTNPMAECELGQMRAFGDARCRDVLYALNAGDVDTSGPRQFYFVAPGASGTGSSTNPAGIGARLPANNETWVLLPGRYTAPDSLAADNFTLLGTYDGIQGATLVAQSPVRLSGDNFVLENLRVEHAMGSPNNHQVLNFESGTFTASVVEVLGSAHSTAELTVVNSSIKAGDTRALVQRNGARQLVVENSELSASGGVWNASTAATTFRGVRIIAPQGGRLGAQFSNHGAITFERVVIAGSFKVGLSVVERDAGHAINLNHVIVDLGTDQLSDEKSRGISFADSSTTTQVGETITLSNISVRGAFIGLDISRGQVLPLRNILLQENIKSVVSHPKNSELLSLKIDGLWIDMQTRYADQRNGFALDLVSDLNPRVEFTDVMIRDKSVGVPLDFLHSNATMTNDRFGAHLVLTRARINSGWRKGIVGFTDHELTDVVFDRCRGVSLVGPITRELPVDFKLNRVQLNNSAMLVLGQRAEVTDLTIDGVSEETSPAYESLPQVCLRNDTQGFLRRFSFSRPTARGSVIGFQEQRDPLPVGEFEFADGAMELAPGGQLLAGGQCVFSTDRLSDRARISFTNVNVTAAASE